MNFDNIKSLVLTLHEPARIFVSDVDIEWGKLILDGRTLSIPSFPAYPVCADLLINSKSDEFIGLNYSVSPAGKEIVNSLIATLSSSVAKYVNTNRQENITGDAQDNLEPDSFQIKWSTLESDVTKGAQLSCDYWYYDYSANNGWQFVALGLSGIDEILFENKLRFPSINHLQTFEAKFANC